jgi:hypothetical protein
MKLHGGRMTSNYTLERSGEQLGVPVPRFAYCARLHQLAAVAGRSAKR